MVAYGYEVSDSEPDRLIELSKVSNQHFSDAMTPGAFLVDTFPIREFPRSIICLKPSG